MDERKDIICNITDLPVEIIILILKKSSYKDIISLGRTCKHFHCLTNNDQVIWKNKCVEELPVPMFKTVEEHCDGNWLNELKKYHKLQNEIITKLLTMSPKFYWKMNQLTLQDTKEFFTIGTKDELSYYYSLHILQNVIRQGLKNLEKYISVKPYTLTEIYYAKAVLRFLFHTMLTIKWVKLKMTEELTPEVVINLFVQWIDPTNFYMDEDINDALNEIVEDVKNVIRENRARRPPPPGRKKVRDREVLAAMAEVLFRQRHIALTQAANLDNLDIMKVLENKKGNATALAAIYRAVAKKCGVKLELTSFPNHLFLEWLDDTDPRNVLVFTVSLETGELLPKRQCPFSNSNPRFNYAYCPDSLLHYVYSSFLVTMDVIRNWNTQNAFLLFNFFGANQNHHNPYKNFFTYLNENPDSCAPDAVLDMKYLSPVYRQTILTLSAINKYTESEDHMFIRKKHNNNVIYAVGMICYHKKYDYICVIRGWDLNGDRVHAPVDDLYFGRKQPFYRVTAVDQSERYVAQENLIEMSEPVRIYHVEDLIAKEFSHFDGFVYVLNDEKRMEYPDEGPVIDMYRRRFNVAI